MYVEIQKFMMIGNSRAKTVVDDSSESERTT